MRLYNNDNERLKRRYLQYAKVARGLSENTLDRIAASIDRFQDAREMRTKFSKTFETWFFPVSEIAMQIVEEYVSWKKRTVYLDPVIRFSLGLS